MLKIDTLYWCWSDGKGEGSHCTSIFVFKFVLHKNAIEYEV